MTILVVDGNSILNRAFYGIRPLTTKDGQPTNAIYGFLTMLEKIKTDTNPDRVAIAFDLKAPTFRHKAYDGYKSNRKGMPDELAAQVKPLKELLTLLGYTLVTCEGYEADDILGTLSNVADKTGHKCFIATGDRDSLQLVTDNVTVDLASNKANIMYTPEKIMEDYGVTPKQLIDIKAIQGDTSDCIPGVAGIGPKGAGDLIQRFNNLDYIYENIETIDIKEGVRNKLIAGKENAFLSRMLGEISLNAPIDTDLDSYKVNLTDPEAAEKYMGRLELFSLINKMNLREMAPIDNIEKVTDKKVISLLEIKTIQTSDLYFISQFENNELTLVIAVEDKVLLLKDESAIKRLLTDESINKYTFDSKPLFAYADKMGYEIKSLKSDLLLSAYLLQPSASAYSIENQCAAYNLNPPVIENSDKELYSYVYLLPELNELLSKDIEEKGMSKLLYDIEIPLANVLAKMENIGFSVDKQGIEKYGEIIGEKLVNIQQEIYNLHNL